MIIMTQKVFTNFSFCRFSICRVKTFSSCCMTACCCSLRPDPAPSSHGSSLSAARGLKGGEGVWQPLLRKRALPWTKQHTGAQERVFNEYKWSHVRWCNYCNTYTTSQQFGLIKSFNIFLKKVWSRLHLADYNTVKILIYYNIIPVFLIK